MELGGLRLWPFNKVKKSDANVQVHRLDAGVGIFPKLGDMQLENSEPVFSAVI